MVVCLLIVDRLYLRQNVEATKLTTFKNRLIYLTPALGESNLFLVDPNNLKPAEQLTFEKYGVNEFSVSANGTLVIYSSNRDSVNMAHDFWLLDISSRQKNAVLACVIETCTSPTWSSDGKWVAYERRTRLTENAQNTWSLPEIWLIDMTTSKTKPFYASGAKWDNQIDIYGANPQWSPSGNLLAYYAISSENILIADQVSGVKYEIPNVRNGIFTWSPDCTKIIFVSQPIAEINQQQLMLANLMDGTVTAITPLDERSWTKPAWGSHSQNGNIAVAAKEFVPLSTVVMGYHLYVLSLSQLPAMPDKISYATDTSYGGIRWSGDGKWLAVVINTLTATDEPMVRIINTRTRNQVLIANNATLPEWVK
jgi:dipeptidyl aminopeptidase/acylaminoacyl peptidase